MEALAVDRMNSVYQRDAAVTACTKSITRVRERERQRRYRFKTGLLQLERRPIISRHQWIDVNMEGIRQKHLVRIGQRLEQTTTRLRATFKRVADSERGQTVSRIDHMHGADFTRNMTVAANLAL
uniref:Uncharacterized protein n=1 Tax=Hyaloperonospora arabidopsidis (strain Emoy2) TaxID=559515 RepID=M4BHS7_HYAAE